MVFSERTFKIASALFVTAFILILCRLYYLQIIRGAIYVEKSESNFIQEVPIAHNRGLIFDQNGKTLVDNRPSRDLYVTFAMLPDERRMLRRLSSILGIKRQQLDVIGKNIATMLKNKDKEPVSLGEDLLLAQCRRIEQIIASEKIPGIDIDWMQNRTNCDVSIDVEKFPSQQAAFKRIQKLVGLNDDEMEKYVQSAQKKAEGLGRFKPTLFVSDIDFEAYARIEAAAALGDLPGVAIYDSKKRRYIFGKLASHALGFLNEMSPQDLKKKQDLGYRQGDRIGRRGVEAVYESALRGEDGIERFVVDAKGRRYGETWENSLLGEERIVSPSAGNNLYLSLDYDLQETAERAFQGVAGSVIAIDVNTGFILALASFPSYDPNEIISRNNAAAFKRLTEDPNKTWINKAIQEHYAPGSTFKAITAIAGLEHKAISVDTRHNCRGAFTMGRNQWRCFKREGHGVVGLVDALKTSCDVYFYNVGHELGSERLAETAKLLGFGRKSGIDLDMETAGLMPSRSYYLKRFKYDAPGFVINSAIGQGDVTVTPIQLAVAYAAIVNGGTIYKPQMIREITDPDGKILEKKEPVVVAHLAEEKQVLSQVKEGLSYVMQPGGTAYSVLQRSDLPELTKWLRESGIVIGGKTGTAQVVRLSKAVKHLDVDKVRYEQRDHAWFVGFSPAEKPEIVVVAMTEHGGFGGTASAPVVMQVIKTWFEKVKAKPRYSSQGMSYAVVR